MEVILIIAVCVSLLLTFVCALTEAALYSVPYAFVKHIAEEGSHSGRVLLGFKEDMGNPITAILVVNTLGATFGSAVVGGVAGMVFPSSILVVFALVYTMATLYLAEIVPKILGVNYAKQISRATAIPLSLAVLGLRPLIWLSQKIHRNLAPSDEEPSVSQEEVLSIAAIGTEEGILDSFEGSVISNVIGLDQVFVRDVLTPRVVVFRLSEETEIQSLKSELPKWPYSRVPLHSADNSDHLVSYVILRDVYGELISENGKKLLKEIARPLTIVPELMRVDQLLLKMFEREHVCGVVDEHGSFVGVITLEDIIEEIVGQEIVDEYDQVSDMRSLARAMRMAKMKAHRERRKETLAQYVTKREKEKH